MKEGGPERWSQRCGTKCPEGCESRLRHFHSRDLVLGARLAPTSHLILLFAFPASANASANQLED